MEGAAAWCVAASALLLSAALWGAAAGGDGGPGGGGKGGAGGVKEAPPESPPPAGALGRVGTVAQNVAKLAAALEGQLGLPEQERRRDESALRAVLARAKDEAAADIIDERRLWAAQHLRESREAFAAAAEALDRALPAPDAPPGPPVAVGEAARAALDALHRARTRAEGREELRRAWTAAQQRSLRPHGELRSTLEDVTGRHPLMLEGAAAVSAPDGWASSPPQLVWHESGYLFLSAAPPRVWRLGGAPAVLPIEQVKDLAVTALSAALGREVSTKGRWAAFNAAVAQADEGSADKLFVALTKVATINGCRTPFGIAPTDRVSSGPKGKIRRRRPRAEVGWALLAAPRGRRAPGNSTVGFEVRREGLLSGPDLRGVAIRPPAQARPDPHAVARQNASRALLEDPRVFRAKGELWASWVAVAEGGSRVPSFAHGIARTLAAPLRVSGRRQVAVDTQRAVQLVTSASSMERWQPGGGLERGAVVFEASGKVWAELSVEPHFVCQLDLQSGRCGAPAGLPEHHTTQPLLRVMTLGRHRAQSSPHIALPLAPPPLPPSRKRRPEGDDLLRLPEATLRIGGAVVPLSEGMLLGGATRAPPLMLGAASAHRQGWMFHHFWYAFLAHPPFTLHAVSHEWCFPYDRAVSGDYPGAAQGYCPLNDTAQSVSGILRDSVPGTLLVAFGEQDCVSRVVRVSEQHIADSLHPLAAPDTH
eukprot:TRINITY_DN40186_c0_g1_i1.p1 TRINITY_DN40186_c0_g1~~TRINITY_DN40186_c0_g1_i1.p1  ORF type:complete len:739 (+),score=198.01 TRINITY_DN40186_c0_g1_i1:96-2219(+)